MTSKKTNKLVMLAILIAINTILTKLVGVYGLAPISSVMNMMCAILIGPAYTTLIAAAAALLRVLLLGSSIITIPGAVFGAALAGIFYKLYPRISSSIVGEFIGTGIIGALVSAWLISGDASNLFVFMPSFIGACIIGAIITFPVVKALEVRGVTQRMREVFSDEL